jgi:hypothetical protein
MYCSFLPLLLSQKEKKAVRLLHGAKLLDKGVTGIGPVLSSASSSSHYSGNVLILRLYPTCMHNTFQQHPSRRTSRFTILEWVIFQENHGTKTLRTTPSQGDNKLSSLVGQEEVLTSLVMGCL